MIDASSGSGECQKGTELLNSRNMMSWRVPNEVTINKGRDGADITSLEKVSKENDIPDVETNILSKEPFYDSTVTDSMSEDTRSTFQSRLWRVLFSNISRSIDELYDLCEDENNEEKCNDAIDFFERSKRDFVKLIERIEEQRRFEMDQQGGVCWEVRKPGRRKQRQDIESIVITNKLNSPDSKPNGSALLMNLKAANESEVEASSNNFANNNNNSNNIENPELSANFPILSPTIPSPSTTVTPTKPNLITNTAVIHSKLRVTATPFQPSFPLEKAVSPILEHGISNKKAADTGTNVDIVTLDDTTSKSSTEIEHSDRITKYHPNITNTNDGISTLMFHKESTQTNIINNNSIVSESNYTKVNAVQPSLMSSETTNIPSKFPAVEYSTTTTPPYKHSTTIPSPPPTTTTTTTTTRTTTAAQDNKSLQPISLNSFKEMNSESFTNPINEFSSIKLPESLNSDQTTTNSLAFKKENEKDKVIIATTTITTASATATIKKQGDKEEWDADTKAAVELASEEVWAAAEAWVEAEAVAEEEAWKLLFLPDDPHGINFLDDVTSFDDDILFRGLQSPRRRTSRLSRYGVDYCEDDTDLDNSEDRSSDTLATTTTDVNDNNNSTNIKLSIIPDEIEEEEEEEAAAFLDTSVSTTGVSGSMSPSMFSVTTRSPLLPSPTSSFGTAIPSIHYKLSSPDRKRLSPDETRRRIEARQEAAEQNRFKSVNEKKLKAQVNTSRVKAHGLLVAQRTALAEQLIMEKQREAEKRHKQYLKVIKGKAGNENAKVSEIIFINTLNAEALSQDLQQRLVEVERRIVAGRQRRSDILEDITVRQKKRGIRQSQQMSALRLQLETKKMERWETLHRRLESVQNRRLDRIKEIQRRKQELSVTNKLKVVDSQSNLKPRNNISSKTSLKSNHTSKSNKQEINSQIISTTSTNKSVSTVTENIENIMKSDDAMEKCEILDISFDNISTISSTTTTANEIDNRDDNIKSTDMDVNEYSTTTTLTELEVIIDEKDIPSAVKSTSELTTTTTTTTTTASMVTEITIGKNNKKKIGKNKKSNSETKEGVDDDDDSILDQYLKEIEVNQLASSPVQRMIDMSSPYRIMRSHMISDKIIHLKKLLMGGCPSNLTYLEKYLQQAQYYLSTTSSATNPLNTSSHHHHHSGGEEIIHKVVDFVTLSLRSKPELPVAFPGSGPGHVDTQTNPKMDTNLSDLESKVPDTAGSLQNVLNPSLDSTIPKKKKKKKFSTQHTPINPSKDLESNMNNDHYDSTAVKFKENSIKYLKMIKLSQKIITTMPVSTSDVSKEIIIKSVLMLINLILNSETEGVLRGPAEWKVWKDSGLDVAVMDLLGTLTSSGGGVGIQYMLSEGSSIIVTLIELSLVYLYAFDEWRHTTLQSTSTAEGRQRGGGGGDSASTSSLSPNKHNLTVSKRKSKTEHSSNHHDNSQRGGTSSSSSSSNSAAGGGSSSHHSNITIQWPVEFGILISLFTILSDLTQEIIIKKLPRDDVTDHPVPPTYDMNNTSIASLQSHYYHFLPFLMESQLIHCTVLALGRSQAILSSDFEGLTVGQIKTQKHLYGLCYRQTTLLSRVSQLLSMYISIPIKDIGGIVPSSDISNIMSPEIMLVAIKNEEMSHSLISLIGSLLLRGKGKRRRHSDDDIRSSTATATSTSFVSSPSRIASGASTSSSRTGNNKSHKGSIPVSVSLPLSRDSESSQHTLSAQSLLLSLSYQIFELLNHLAFLDLSLVQDLPVDILLSLSHSADWLLDWSIPLVQSTNTNMSTTTTTTTSSILDNSLLQLPPTVNPSEFPSLLLSQLLSLLGYVSFQNKQSQEVLGLGPPPSVLSRLACLPMKYFCDEMYKQQLLPCLACLCYQNEMNVMALRVHMNPLLLSHYFGRMIKLSKRYNTLHRINYNSNNLKCTENVDENLLIDLQRRIPLVLWNDFEKYFSN